MNNDVEVRLLNLGRKRIREGGIRNVRCTTITVSIPKSAIAEIRRLVDQKRYKNRSEFIREAVNLLLLLNKIGYDGVNDVINEYTR